MNEPAETYNTFKQFLNMLRNDREFSYHVHLDAMIATAATLTHAHLSQPTSLTGPDVSELNEFNGVR